MNFGDSAGSVVCSITEWLKFIDFLISMHQSDAKEDIIKKETFEKIVYPQNILGVGRSYAMGLFQCIYRGKTFWMHGGGVNG
jgi:hypothetical protein